MLSADPHIVETLEAPLYRSATGIATSVGVMIAVGSAKFRAPKRFLFASIRLRSCGA